MGSWSACFALWLCTYVGMYVCMYACIRTYLCACDMHSPLGNGMLVLDRVCNAFTDCLSRAAWFAVCVYTHGIM